MNVLAPWRPLGAFADFGPEMNQLFRHFFGDRQRGGIERWSPDADLMETPESYLVKLEVPGIDPDDLEVTLDGNVLSIKGERRQEEKRERDDWRFVERSYGRFERVFTLPKAAETGQVEAITKDGVLTVRVMKAEESKPKKIKVGTS